MRIIVKLTLLILVITGIITVSYLFLFQIYGKQIIQERIEAQLNSVSILKQNQLNFYVDVEKEEIASLTEESSLIDLIKNINKKTSETNYENEEKIRQILQDKSICGDFSEVFIMDTEGKIIISTDTKQEGKIKTEDYVSEGKKGLFVQNFYYSLVLNAPALTISAPIKDKEGNLLGVLAGRVNLKIISDMMTERTGLGESGETFLVNKYNYLVSEAKFLKGQEFKKTMYTEIVKKCLADKDRGFLVYNDYRNVKVFGYYSWIPEREVCIIAEIDYDEALSALVKSKNRVIFVVLIIFAFSLFMTSIFSKEITKPINELRDIAAKIGKGELDTKIKITSGDEIQELAETVILMEEHLKKYQKELLKVEKEKGNLLEKEVKKRTAELTKKTEALEKFSKTVINRELKMIELKKKIEDLEGKLSERERESKNKK